MEKHRNTEASAENGGLNKRKTSHRHRQSVFIKELEIEITCNKGNIHLLRFSKRSESLRETVRDREREIERDRESGIEMEK